MLIVPRQLVDVPKICKHCHGELVFELQILPTIIDRLQLMSDVEKKARIEFANVLLFTCRQSCWASDSTFKQEAIVLQTEDYY